MSLLFFFLGATLGGIVGIFVMSMIYINHLPKSPKNKDE